MRRRGQHSELDVSDFFLSSSVRAPTSRTVPSLGCGLGDTSTGRLRRLTPVDGEGEAEARAGAWFQEGGVCDWGCGLGSLPATVRACRSSTQVGRAPPPS